MVLLGGLEVLAAGYFVHQHQKNKKERQRIEEEEEEDERRRAERHARRRERRERRSESTPPNAYRPSKDPKYAYGSPPPTKSHHAPSQNPTQYWVPSGPPPPMQYVPQPPAATSVPPKNPQFASPLPTKAQPYFPPHQPQTSYQPQPSYTPPVAAPVASPSSYDLPPSAYEMPSGEVPSQYLYSNMHIPELRSSSPPLGERPEYGSGRRRARSSSRVRFALPAESDDGRLVEVTPGSPPPPYHP